MALTTEHLHLIISLDLCRAIDNYRRHIECPPTRPKAAIELLRQGLAAAGIKVDDRSVDRG